MPEEIGATLKSAGLSYTTDQRPGITRKRRGKTFEYFEPDGKKVTDEGTLQRIRSLAIPPAYEDVWICTRPNGHLQATGRDARGRKQYRYHDKFREVRDSSKYERLATFAKALPKLHRTLDKDLALRGMPREKVLAVVVNLLERSLIRVGNPEYARSNGHFGLTTLRNRHVDVKGSDISFNFVGKSGVKHRVKVQDRRLASVVKRLQELPGQELFQYLDDEGQPKSVSSSDVNDYLRETMGEEFTAKDFRTWAGTVLAITRLVGEDPPTSETQAKATLSQVVKEVSLELGNTPTVCRKCYIHPVVIEAFKDGTLADTLSKGRGAIERKVVRLLEAAPN